jgi:hypothetical protein
MPQTNIATDDKAPRTTPASEPGPQVSGNGYGVTPTQNNDDGKNVAPLSQPEIPPPDAVKSPNKFSRFKVSENIVATAGEAAAVEVKRPDNGVFIRTHSDHALWEAVWCFERKAGGKRLYLIDPQLSTLPEIEGMTKKVLFAPYCTQFGGLGLWPISIDYDELAWIKSALHICAEAVEKWVSATSVKKQQQYRLQYATRDFGPPPWPPNLTQEHLLSLAFREADMILNRDHDALRAIRGEN